MEPLPRNERRHADPSAPAATTHAPQAWWTTPVVLLAPATLRHAIKDFTTLPQRLSPCTPGARLRAVRWSSAFASGEATGRACLVARAPDLSEDFRADSVGSAPGPARLTSPAGVPHVPCVSRQI
jgi:hypothetical protein